MQDDLQREYSARVSLRCVLGKLDRKPQGSFLAVSLNKTHMQEDRAGCALVVWLLAFAVACSFVYKECVTRDQEDRERVSPDLGRS